MISSKEPLKSDIKKVRVQQTADKKHNESA